METTILTQSQMDKLAYRNLAKYASMAGRETCQHTWADWLDESVKIDRDCWVKAVSGSHFYASDQRYAREVVANLIATMTGIGIYPGHHWP